MANAVIIDPNWLEGVRAAANFAHDFYDRPNRDEITDAVIAAKVREEAGF